MSIWERRVTHWLRRNHGDSLPQQLVFVDTEATREVLDEGEIRERHTLALGVAKYVRMEDCKPTREQWLEFRTPEQFWSWLAQFHDDKRSVWLFAHNLGYDLTLLRFWELLQFGPYDLGQLVDDADEEGKQRRGFKGFVCVSDPPNIIISRYQKSTLCCVDTRNYWPMSLARLGESIGVPKLEMPGDSGELQQWVDYCSRDVRIIADAIVQLMQWWSAEKLGAFRYSAGGLAWHAFRHRFMNHRILIDDCQPACELGRQALVGGETRCFYVGRVTPPDVPSDSPLFGTGKPGTSYVEGPVHVVDATGFYPSVMKDNLFPARLLAWKENGSEEDLRVWGRLLGLVAAVEVDTTERPYPVVVDEQRYFAIGRFWTVLCGPELQEAMRRRHIRNVGRIAAYELRKLFDNYVSYFWEQRAAAQIAGNPAADGFAKLLLNSLGGKFGQKSPQWRNTGEIIPQAPWGIVPRFRGSERDPRTFRSIAGRIQVQMSPEETMDSFPAVEAWITAYGRQRMLEIRRDVGEEYVLYQDTDSLHLLPQGYRRLEKMGLLGSGELGKFRLEGVYDTAEYRGLKDYTVGGKVVVAGLKAKAREVSPGVWEQELFEGIDSLIDRGPDGSVYTYRQTFAIGRSHPRGIVEENGRVSPPLLLQGRLHLERGKGRRQTKRTNTKRPRT